MAYNFISQLISVINYMHSNGIVHRNFSLHNILIMNDSISDELCIKIINFHHSEKLNANDI
jgi:serine/threonine protein kinase